MAVQQKDYYKILGVARSATAEEIKRAFRQKAKASHPDHHPGSSKNEERFKDLSESYEVLSDDEKRQRYDRLTKAEAAGSKTARRPRPRKTPGARRTRSTSRSSSNGGTQRREGQFFSSIFGSNKRADSAPDGPGAQSGSKPDRRSEHGSAKGSALESEMTITLEEAFRGGPRRITLALRESRPFGGSKQTRRTCEIKIPPGIRDGQRIRLSVPAPGSKKKKEEVYIRVRIAPHPVFSFENDDLVAELRVSPWEAAMGARVPAPTLDGNVDLKLPEGISSGQKLRLRGKGFPRKGGASRDDLYYRIMIVMPGELTVEEKGHFKKLGEISRFDPRS